jgi:CRISPR-associated protein Cmr3
MLQFVFSQIDSWCFREARPMGALGGTAIESLFPPPAHTLIGACRTLIGDSQNINWQDFAANKLPQLQALLGNGEHTGQLSFTFPYLRGMINGKPQRLYPVPAFLLSNQSKLLSLKVSDKPVHCDLGKVLLPELPAGAIAAKPLDSHWVTAEGFACLQAGKLPATEHIIALDSLLTKEVRLGIGRNNTTASVERGLLYQTEHVRLAENGQKQTTSLSHLELVVEVEGLSAEIAATLQQQAWQIRLGGEGRMAEVQVIAQPTAAANFTAHAQRAWLYLSAPADLDGWLPAHFNPMEVAGFQGWQGEIGGYSLVIRAFCAGKALKLGGWDSAKRQPKPVKSLVPTGACYLIECENMSGLAQVLAEHPFGKQTDFGFGAALLLPVIE